MAAMPATSSRTRWHPWANRPSRSSSDPIPQKASSFCPADGSSKEHSPGSVDAADWPKTGKPPSPHRSPVHTSRQSACSHDEPQNTAALDTLSNRPLNRTHSFKSSRLLATMLFWQKAKRIHHWAQFSGQRGIGDLHRIEVRQLIVAIGFERTADLVPTGVGPA